MSHTTSGGDSPEVVLHVVFGYAEHVRAYMRRHGLPATQVVGALDEARMRGSRADRVIRVTVPGLGFSDRHGGTAALAEAAILLMGCPIEEVTL